MRIFFAGALTNLPDPQQTKLFYERLGQLASSYGFKHYWAYQHGTDPILNPDIPAQKVYEIDESELKKSDLMIAYVGQDSTGTGIEIEFAKNQQIPVYLLYEKGKHVSRMVRGCPAVKGEIVYESQSDALTKVERLLRSKK